MNVSAKSGLGSSRQGKLALWQVIARVIDQGSRLSAVRLASSHAACDILGITESFNEDDLYRNLDWLYENQQNIENRLFKQRYKNSYPDIYLYDVTSSYLEGQHNELAAFGYNRDGKKCKKQIVVGLLCDSNGVPLSIEVFTGNTSDVSTVASQIHKIKERFGAENVTFVGDRGMIKSKQVEDLVDYGIHYITAITKVQIETLVKNQVIDMSVFDSELAQIEAEDIRYILRRNPFRASEIKAARDKKFRSLEMLVEKKNAYLLEHKKAKVETAIKAITGYISRLKLTKWVKLEVKERTISFVINKDILEEDSKLDGCYVLKTDLKKELVDKEIVHSRYKDLAKVESAFKVSKTAQLELRPINVRLKERTKAHVFVVMLAYLIVQELTKRWKDIDITVEEGLKELGSLCATDVDINKKVTSCVIPKPNPTASKLLKAAGITLPKALPSRGTVVATRHELAKKRIKR